MRKNTVIPTLRLADHDVAELPSAEDFAKLPAPLTNMLTAELDGARAYLGVPAEEILLAALGRTISRTIGDGDVSVDFTAGRRFTVTLTCVGPRKASATEVLGAVHGTLTGMPRRRSERNFQSAHVFFSYLGALAEPAGGEPVTPPIAALPVLGHALELRVYRVEDQLQMDWWYDTRRLDRTTVEELTEQFPLALIEITSEAIPPVYADTHVATA